MGTILYGIIVNPKEQFLILQDTEKKWTYPAVILEEGMNSEAALLETIKEQSGMDVEILYQFHSTMMKIEKEEFFAMCFLCRPKSSKIKTAEDFVASKWAGLAEIKKLKLVNTQMVEMAQKAVQLMSGGGSEE